MAAGAKSDSRAIRNDRQARSLSFHGSQDGYSSSHCVTSNRAMRLAALFEVALMIVFRAPEFRSRFDLGDDRTAKAPALVQLFLGNFCCCLLLGRMIENHRAILRSNIRTLAIQRRGIVVRPKNVKQFVIGDLRG